MKNFIYISLLMLGLFATSCTKEEVIMSNANTDAVPTWGNTPFQEKGTPPVVGGAGASGQGSGGVLPVDDVNPSEDDITDPNNDPDGKKKKV